MPSPDRTASRLTTPYRVRFVDVFSALPDFALAAMFAIGWIRPHAPGIPSVKRLVMIVRQMVVMTSWAVSVAACLFAVRIGAVTEPPALGSTQTVIALWELFVPPLVFRHERHYDAIERGRVIIPA